MLERFEIRGTGVEISHLGLGAGPLGNLFSEVLDDEADTLLRGALARGVSYFDVAPLYGFGLAEQRLGRVLRTVDRDSFVVSTKVGRLLRADAPPDPELFSDGKPFFTRTPPVNPIWDFSYEGAITSLGESLDRLGLDRVDVVFVHEPPEELMDTAIRGAYRALAELRREGSVRAIGLGWDRSDLMAAFLRETDLDCVLLANRYTLLDQTALQDLLPLCERRGTAVIAGGVLNSGILADPRPGTMFEYVAAPAAVLEHAIRLQEACVRRGVPLLAAALQFPLRHPAIGSVLVGVRSLAELEESLAAFEHEVPASLWDQLTDIQGEAPPESRTIHGTRRTGSPRSTG